MTLRLKAPKFVMNIACRYISKCLSEESGMNINLQVNEMEIGMRNKRVYTHIDADADIDRKDLMKLIKKSIFSKD